MQMCVWTRSRRVGWSPWTMYCGMVKLLTRRWVYFFSCVALQLHVRVMLCVFSVFLNSSLSAEVVVALHCFHPSELQRSLLRSARPDQIIATSVWRQRDAKLVDGRDLLCSGSGQADCGDPTIERQPRGRWTDLVDNCAYWGWGGSLSQTLNVWLVVRVFRTRNNRDIHDDTTSGREWTH